MKLQALKSLLILTLVAQNLIAGSTHSHVFGHDSAQKPHVHIGGGHHHVGHHHLDGSNHNHDGGRYHLIHDIADEEQSNNHSFIVVSDILGILPSTICTAHQHILAAKPVVNVPKTEAKQPQYLLQSPIKTDSEIYKKNCVLIL